MNKKNLYVILILLSFIFSACAGQGSYLNPDDTGLIENGLDENDTYTSSTKFGNPSLKIDISSHVLLTLEENQDNLKQINKGTLSSVLSFSDPDLATETLLETLEIPSVKTFTLGFSDEVVMVFDEPISWDENSTCLIVYTYAEDVKCVHEADFDIIDRVQFDIAGNVYYFGKDLNTNTEALIKWDQANEEKTYLINQNITLHQWLVHVFEGTVFLTGTSNASFFRAIESDGSITNLIPDEAEIDSFNFISKDLMMIQGSNITYNHIPRSGNFIFNMTDKTVSEMLDFVGGDLINLQMDSLNNVYVQKADKIYKAYPGIPYELILETELSKVSLFKIFDDIMYIAGKEDLIQSLIKIDLLSDNSTEKTIISGHEIYHLVIDGDSLYFDSLDFTDNRVKISQYNTLTKEMTDISDVNNQLVQLESIYMNENYSFYENVFSNKPPYTVEIGDEISSVSDLNPLDIAMTKAEILNGTFFISRNILAENCLTTTELIRLNNYFLGIGCNNEFLVLAHENGTVVYYDHSMPNYVNSLESIFVVSEAENKIAVIGEVTDVLVPYSALMVLDINIYESSHDVAIFSLASTHLDSDSYIGYAVPEKGLIYALSNTGYIKTYDENLNLLSETELFLASLDNARVVSHTDDFLILQSIEQLTETDHESKLVLIDITKNTPKQIQTITTNKFGFAYFMSSDNNTLEFKMLAGKGRYYPMTLTKNY